MDRLDKTLMYFQPKNLRQNKLSDTWKVKLNSFSGFFSTLWSSANDEAIKFHGCYFESRAQKLSIMMFFMSFEVKKKFSSRSHVKVVIHDTLIASSVLQWGNLIHARHCNFGSSSCNK